MSEPIYSDPAASRSGGVGFSESSTSLDDSILTKVARRWWLIAICVAVALIASFAYLVIASKTYTAASVISAEMPTGTPAGDVAPDDFLFKQRDAIQSPPVLASAAITIITSESRVRDALEVSVSKGDGLVTVRYSAPRPDDAARGANAVAESYLRLRSQQQTSTTAGLQTLTQQRDKIVANRTEKENAIRELRQTASASGGEAERAAAARVEQLTQAVTAAEVELANANGALAATKDLLADALKLRTVVDANRGKGIFDRLDAQRAPVESELAQLEKQLEKQRQAMLPQHPVVVGTQRKIDQLKTKLAELDKQYGSVYVTHVEQQRATAQKRVEELKQLAADQAVQAKDYTARAAKLAEMEAELKKADSLLAEADKKIRDATVGAAAGGSSAGPTVKIVIPAQPPSRPSRPDRNRTLLTAAAIGAAAGVLLAAILPRGRG